MADTQQKPNKVTITKKITMSSPESDVVEDAYPDSTAVEDATIAYSMGADNPFRVEDTEEAVTMTLPNSIDLVVSGAFKEALLYATSLNKKLILDGSEAGQLSTPAIQLILATQAELSKAGHEAVLLRPSEEFASAFDDLGLFSSLMKWKVES